MRTVLRLKVGQYSLTISKGRMGLVRVGQVRVVEWGLAKASEGCVRTSGDICGLNER